VAASIVKAPCSKAFYHVAAKSIEMHGGIGFSWMYPLIFISSAPIGELLFGSPSVHRERMATL
jgi:alkylation response protein AidB-like acyl-CoA dehydrogenase